MSVVTFRPNNPLIGKWFDPDEFGSSVEYIIEPTSGGLSVSAVDTSDGEIGQVSQIEHAGATVTFQVLWVSTGRLCQCRLQTGLQGRVQFTFTYTEHGSLQRRAP